MAVVGELGVAKSTAQFPPVVVLWLEYEVLSVLPPVPPDTIDVIGDISYTRWAVMDLRRADRKAEKPTIIVGLPAPRDNQLTTDPANINWNDMNGPQQAAYTGVSFDVVADDAVL